MSAKSGNSLATVLVAAAIVAALYFGREVLLPMALAVLLSFVLAPLVKLLQRLYLPRFAAVTIVVLLAFGVISGLATLMFAQVSQLAGDLPRYQSNLAEKVQALGGGGGGEGGGGEQRKRGERESFFLGGARAPLARGLWGGGGRVAALNTRMGALVSLLRGGYFFFFFFFLGGGGGGEGVFFLGGPAAWFVYGVLGWGPERACGGFWGCFCAFCRILAHCRCDFSLFVATAVDPGWSMMLMTAALFLVVEPLIGHVIEPMVYGHSSGLSPVAVVVSATFWTWLWGPIGLILATPLTMCLVVLGRHVERLKFLEVLLGDRPALSPSESAYQRMLAGDPIEATEQAQSLLKDRTLTEYYEQILMGALRLAWADSQRGRLEQPETQRIRDTVSELVEDLESHVDSRNASSEDCKSSRATSHNWRRASRPRFYRCHRSIRLKER